MVSEIYFFIIVSSLGILWNESLYAITALTDYCNFNVNLLEKYSNFRLPRLHESVELKNLPENTSSYLLIGIFFNWIRWNCRNYLCS